MAHLDFGEVSNDIWKQVTLPIPDFVPMWRKRILNLLSFVQKKCSIGKLTAFVRPLCQQWLFLQCQQACWSPWNRPQTPRDKKNEQFVAEFWFVLSLDTLDKASEKFTLIDKATKANKAFKDCIFFCSPRLLKPHSKYHIFLCSPQPPEIPRSQSLELSPSHYGCLQCTMREK